MKRVWIVSDCVVSPLGNTTLENYQNLHCGNSGISLIEDKRLSPEKIYAARLPDLSSQESVTKLEAISIEAIQTALNEIVIPRDRTLLILSTTKGNIAFLEEGLPGHRRIRLDATAAFLADKFGFKRHLVVSNACVSGVMALIVGKRMIDAGYYDHAVVVGVDVLSKFVVSGFQSLQALSVEPCRPFDAARKGINLGECAAAIVLTSTQELSPSKPMIRISGGGLSNDANHISGPSRTGEELSFAIQHAIQEAYVTTRDLDFISSHGTATLFNDEMEARAFTLMGMEDIPINSLKGYFGHTLGAAGIVEVAMCCRSMIADELIPTKGFEELGVSLPVNIVQSLEHRSLKTCLKTASGFGGCNAAIILQQENN
ncbi:MAG: beta-ketoacyl synthase [Cyclobacteriaceae bacterium]|nr:beta-ketoacyl synthase [Cyclobacteriaceae bacterium]